MPEFEWKFEPTIVTGIWKFAPGVPLEDLQSCVLEWKRREPDALSELYIRGVGKDGARGIGFRYQLQGVNDLDTQEVLQKVRSAFFHKMKDKLGSRFGDRLVGWDFSSPTWTLAEK
jgi:hypothetical protein